jgi:hypothetical protein
MSQKLFLIIKSISNIGQALSLCVLFFILSACGEEERLTPAYEPIQYCEQYDAQLANSNLCILKFEYNFDEFEVNRVGNLKGFPLITDLLNGLTNFFASILTSVSKTKVPFKPIVIEVPKLDRNFIKSIRLKEIVLGVTDSSDYKAKLDFINRLKLRVGTPKFEYHLKSFLPKNQFESIKNGDINEKPSEKKDLVFTDIGSYERGKSYETKRQIKLDVPNINLLELIGNNERIIVQPEVIVEDNPNKNMGLNGSIEFEVEFNLPF